jgi:hypothetical protein
MDLVKIEQDRDGESFEMSGRDSHLIAVKEEEDPFLDLPELKTESGVSCTSLASGGIKIPMAV